MSKKVISVSYGIKGLLDDDYTLYEDGTVLHEYDKNIYPGGQNFKVELTVDQLSDKVKLRLLEASSDEYKALVQKTLKLEQI